MSILFVQRIFFAAILAENCIQYKMWLPSTYSVQNTVLDDEDDNTCLERASVLCWQLCQKGRLRSYNGLNERQVLSRQGEEYGKVAQRKFHIKRPWNMGENQQLETEGGHLR